MDSNVLTLVISNRGVDDVDSAKYFNCFCKGFPRFACSSKSNIPKEYQKVICVTDQRSDPGIFLVKSHQVYDFVDKI